MRASSAVRGNCWSAFARVACGRGELGFALVDRSFERLPLDREDHLVFLDGVAVLEQARTEKTLHARPQIDFFERLGAPDKLGLFGHRPQLGRLDQHRRRRAGLLGIGRTAGRHRRAPPQRRNRSASNLIAPPSRPCRDGKVLQSGYRVSKILRFEVGSVQEVTLPLAKS